MASLSNIHQAKKKYFIIKLHKSQHKHHHILKSIFKTHFKKIKFENKAINLGLRSWGNQQQDKPQSHYRSKQ